MMAEGMVTVEQVKVITCRHHGGDEAQDPVVGPAMANG
jgi:hypothetical protein